MSKNAEEAAMNVFDWLESECVSPKKQDRISELSTENNKQRWDAEMLKWTALSEMYSTVIQMVKDENPYYGERVSYRAEALIKLCFKMKYIELPEYRSLLHYAELKALEYRIEVGKVRIKMKDNTTV